MVLIPTNDSPPRQRRRITNPPPPPLRRRRRRSGETNIPQVPFLNSPPPLPLNGSPARQRRRLHSPTNYTTPQQQDNWNMLMTESLEDVFSRRSPILSDNIPRPMILESDFDRAINLYAPEKHMLRGGRLREEAFVGEHPATQHGAESVALHDYPHRYAWSLARGQNDYVQMGQPIHDMYVPNNIVYGEPVSRSYSDGDVVVARGDAIATIAGEHRRMANDLLQSHRDPYLNNSSQFGKKKKSKATKSKTKPKTTKSKTKPKATKSKTKPKTTKPKTKPKTTKPKTKPKTTKKK